MVATDWNTSLLVIGTFGVFIIGAAGAFVKVFDSTRTKQRARATAGHVDIHELNKKVDAQGVTIEHMDKALRGSEAGMYGEPATNGVIGRLDNVETGLATLTVSVDNLAKEVRNGNGH